MNTEFVEQYAQNLTVYTFNNFKVLVDGDTDALNPEEFYSKINDKSFIYITAPTWKTVNTAMEMMSIKRKLPVISNVAPLRGSGSFGMKWRQVMKENDLMNAPGNRFSYNNEYKPYILRHCPNDGVLLLYVLCGDDQDALQLQLVIDNGDMNPMLEAARQHGLVSLLVYLPIVKGAIVTRVLLTGTCTHERVVEGLRRAGKIPFITREEYKMDERTARKFSMLLTPPEQESGKKNEPPQGREEKRSPKHANKLPKMINMETLKLYNDQQRTELKEGDLQNAYFDVIHLPSDMAAHEIILFFDSWRAYTYFLPSDEYDENLLDTMDKAKAAMAGLKWNMRNRKVRVVPSHKSALVDYLRRLGQATCDFYVTAPIDSSEGFQTISNQCVEQMLGARHDIHLNTN